MQERMSQIVESGLIFLLSELSLVVNAECIQNLFLLKASLEKKLCDFIWQFENTMYSM